MGTVKRGSPMTVSKIKSDWSQNKYRRPHYTGMPWWTSICSICSVPISYKLARIVMLSIINSYLMLLKSSIVLITCASIIITKGYNYNVFYVHIWWDEMSSCMLWTGRKLLILYTYIITQVVYCAIAHTVNPYIFKSLYYSDFSGIT